MQDAAHNHNRQPALADAADSLSDTDSLDAGPMVMSGSSSKSTYFLFLGMGLATLLPWNLFISASEFYSYQFAGSVHQQTFQNSFSVAYMVTNFMFNMYAMVTVTNSDPNRRIFAGLAANTLVYVVGLIMPLMRDYRGAPSFYIVMLQLATTAAASGMLTNSLFALVAHFSPSHVEGVFSGQATAGIIATVAQLVTAYSVKPTDFAASAVPDDKVAEGLIFRTIAYFAFATAVNLFLTAAFWHIKRDPYYRQQSKLACPSSSSLSDVDAESELLISRSTPNSPPLAAGIEAFRTTFKQISGYTYVILLDFSITLAVFPSITAMVTSTSGFKLLTEWHFFLYNCGDLIGRRLAPSLAIFRSSSLFAIALARILFIPAFFACHVSFSVWNNWIESDYVFLALVVLLGITNGFLSTRSAMLAPSLSDQPTIAGSIVAISISTGLAMGSVLSWPVRAAGCMCSPFGGR
ncbi:hypothetical protein LPJ66_000007 [Kickxella alabastrina]|uniref:Uncharacterized protein n=1 Tax=Kickxella alabastrina TaxID=61397 RepID=A0ACC1IX18_9FUNG|nr:hypothetical protein LPJ66_000007 [Kickxella alabastrina]